MMLARLAVKYRIHPLALKDILSFGSSRTRYDAASTSVAAADAASTFVTAADVASTSITMVPPNHSSAAACQPSLPPLPPALPTSYALHTASGLL